MIKYFLETFRAKDISTGAKVLTFATAVRWIGWGIAENLIPIFICVNNNLLPNNKRICRSRKSRKYVSMG